MSHSSVPYVKMVNILTSKEIIWKRDGEGGNLKERRIHVHPINHEHVWGNNNHGGIEDWVVQHA